MRAIAKGHDGGLLAVAGPFAFVSLCCVWDSFEAGVFMGAVAEGLIG